MFRALVCTYKEASDDLLYLVWVYLILLFLYTGKLQK